MTSSEARGAVLAYYRISDLMTQPLTASLRERLENTLEHIETACRLYTKYSAPTRWSRSVVGPVLATGLEAAIDMRRDVPNPGAALRVFGLTGERPLTSQAAWRLIQPFVWEPALCAQQLAKIRKQSGLRLTKLPSAPSPVDVLEELTRPRSGRFPVQMTHWLAEYFRNLRQDGEYAKAYHKNLAELRAYNSRRELQYLASTHMGRGHLTREEWSDLVARGCLPDSWLEHRAAYTVVKAFITEYWEQWQKKPARLAAG